MSCEPLPLMATPLQFQRPAIDDGDAQNQHNPMEFQILTSSHFRLPDGWVVEERPRASNPSHVDRLYISFSFPIIHYYYLFMNPYVTHGNLSVSATFQIFTTVDKKKEY